MNVDAQFPALSFLAQSKGREKTLNQLGKDAHPKDDKYLGLADCCQAVLNDRPRWVVDEYNYLATLNEFISRLPDNPGVRKKIWDKLKNIGHPTAFLDTVVEAAWALYFWDNSIPTDGLEMQLDPSKPKGKDADIVLTCKGIKYWLDAYSVQLDQQLEYLISSMKARKVSRPPYQEIITELTAHAKKKYDDKFKATVNSGSLRGSSVGVLLCVLKAEKIVIPPLSHTLGVEESLPPELSETCPGLDIVWIHTFRLRKGSDLLKPIQIRKWIRKK
jgi:hypothetical protein